MAPSFDSLLLCAEDSSSVFDEGFDEDTWRRSRFHHQQVRDFDGEFDWGLTLQSDECLWRMVEKECEQWHGAVYFNKLQSGDLNFRARNEAIRWIQKVRSHFGFGPLCAYLAINYLDRFLAAYELPKGRSWTMQLLAVACISLAAKFEETEVPLCIDLQIGESKFLFEAKTIQRMELLVLSTLRWRMQSITPFSFIDYFLCKINNDQSPSRTSIIRSTQLILSTTTGIEFLEFKPSEIAAAVAICVVGETQQTVDNEKIVSLLIQHIEKERVLKCIKMIHEIKDSSGSVPSCVPQSPIGVLDSFCLSYLSYKSDDSNSSHNSNTPDAKRRKLNKTCGAEE